MPWLRAAANAVSSRSSSALRLGSPVSGSWLVRKKICWRAVSSLSWSRPCWPWNSCASASASRCSSSSGGVSSGSSGCTPLCARLRIASRIASTSPTIARAPSEVSTKRLAMAPMSATVSTQTCACSVSSPKTARASTYTAQNTAVGIAPSAKSLPKRTLRGSA